MWIGDYSYYPINAEYLPIAVLSAMQYGQALDHLIREVVIEEPDLGHVYFLKTSTGD